MSWNIATTIATYHFRFMYSKPSCISTSISTSTSHGARRGRDMVIYPTNLALLLTIISPSLFGRLCHFFLLCEPRTPTKFFDTCLGAPDTSSVPFTFDKWLKRVRELGSKKIKATRLSLCNSTHPLHDSNPRTKKMTIRSNR